MNDLDMSRPGTELFPEQSNQQYNSYADVNSGHAVGDPLNMGVKQNFDVAGQNEMFEEAQPSGRMSDKEMNFKALRAEAARLKEESAYWKGQAEAFKVKQEPEQTSDPYSKLDWDDASDVKKAFETLREQNESLRYEIKDAFKALDTKSTRRDWDTMVTQHVPELTSKNPIFSEMINRTSNPYEAAYLLAELNARASQNGQHSNPQSQMSGEAQRAMHNAQKPQTLASVGGRATLSSADYYASMSDKDFMELAARNLANI